MIKIHRIQYLPLTRPMACYSLIKKLNSYGASSILDLEDSAQDILDTEVTDSLKEIARNGLVDISKYNFDQINQPIYIRLNSINTKYFKKDFDAIIKSCENGMNIKGIFLPMVGDYTQINDLNNLIVKTNYKLEIVPMIETVKGLNNLENILKNDVKKNLFQRIHYGNFDYCADAKLWPYLDPNHDYFWKIIKKIVNLLTKYNKAYVHTPFPFPQNEKFFWESLKELSKIDSDLEFWGCTVNSQLAISKQPSKINNLKIHKYNYSEEEKIYQAEKIYNDFLEGKSIKRSFGVKDNRFIAPHQFLTAKKYLNKN